MERGGTPPPRLDGADATGAPVAPGIHMARVRAGARTAVVRVAVIR
jgi:hypothetical protein